MSGTGQANQLPYYERNRAELAPDLVVLLFIKNDFANNSPLLEAVRHGWDPERSPRAFLRPDCSRIGIAADWQRHVLPAATTAERIKLLRARSAEADRKLTGWDGSVDIDLAFYRTELMAPVFADAL